ncbi:MAG: insulinase family protein [Clostridia bacterium]|nr:insulinase family protein [Clostridia bacterium]
MRPEIYTLASGARLVYIATDRFKSELLSLTAALPLAAATAQENAMVLSLARRGTVTYPSQLLLNRHLDGLYSTCISTANRRTGDMQALSFTADFLGARFVGGGLGLLPQVAAVLAELWQSPCQGEAGGYLSAYVESEKQVLLDAIRARINAPRAYARTGCRRLLCENEPFALSLIGEADTVEALNGKALAARHQALFTSAALVFCYVGATPAREVIALLDAQFAVSAAPTPHKTDFHAHMGAPREATEEMPLAQGKLSLGFRTDLAPHDALSAALVVMNEIYGGSPASKLFLNVRERRSLCYSCASTLDIYKGVMFADCGMRAENRALCEEAMLSEFAALARGEISDTEFSAAKRALANAYRQSHDSAAALARFHVGRLLVDKPEFVDDWREAISRVTKEQVVAAAARVAHGATFFLSGTLTDEEVEE